jgi:uncharacterized protein (DUF952 family)
MVTSYHLVPREEYERTDSSTDYLPSAFAADGFIHLTDGADELATTGNRYYRADPRAFLALAIDLARVTAPVRYEDPRRIYPHIYGPLNRDAIVAVVDVPRAPDGTFLPPEDET